MDVGVDTAKRLLGEYRPFSDFEINYLLGEKLGHDHIDFYRNSEEHRSLYQVNFNGDVVMEPPSLETRAATNSEVLQWMRTRSSC